MPSPAKHSAPVDNHAAAGKSAADRYEVLGRAGAGSLFSVYRVRDRQSGRILALRALKSAFVNHPSLTANLARCAEQTLALNHAYLGRTSDFGVAEGTLFIVSEWQTGASLDERLRQGPLGNADVLLYTRQIAEALHYLNSNGIPHGDVRPRQIYLTSPTQVKLTEPGMAAGLHQSGISAFDVQPEIAHFLAPERFDGAPPTAATDFYSLGVILYAMLTGRVPFDGPTPLIIANRHRSDMPLHPTQFNPECDGNLAALAMALLNKNPQHRVEAARTFLAQIGGSGAQVYHSPYAPAAGRPVPVVEEPQPTLRDVLPPRVEVAHEEIREEALDRHALWKRHKRHEFKSAALALFWLVALFGVIGSMGYGAYVFWVEGIPPEVRVPQYTNLSRDEAEKVLVDAGLRMKIGPDRYNPKVPADTILSGDVPPGKLVREGREIVVVISKGEEPIEMYDFRELSIKRAREIITRDGMRTGIVTEQFHEKIPSGYVCGQFPEPGMPFKRSEQVNLTVSKGPAPRTEGDPDLEELPPAPTAPPSVVPEPEPDTTSPSVPMVSRTVQIRVVLPKGGQEQRVKIVVDDAKGEETVYDEEHQPGQLVDQTVRVRRPQGEKASVSIFIGGKLFKEERI